MNTKKVRLIPGNGWYANAYLAGSVLVDAGVTPVLIEPYRSEITHIILTHAHYDHIAYLAHLAEYTGAEISIHSLDSGGLINDQDSLSMHFGAHSPGIQADHLLADGDTIEGWTVMHTPGHTRGSICLYDPLSKTLISGDTVFSDGGFGRYDFIGGSREQLTESLERLAMIPVEGLYPGHGLPVLSGGSRHISAAVQMIQRYG